MRIGNINGIYLRGAALPVEGKIYWWLSVGRNAHEGRFFENGWNGFEFMIIKYQKSEDPGMAQPYIFRLRFAFWLPVQFY